MKHVYASRGIEFVLGSGVLGREEDEWSSRIQGRGQDEDGLF